MYIHISRMICDWESSCGTPSSGGHKKRPSRKQVGNFWVVFNWTETSRPFHFMSYFPTTMLCSFGVPTWGLVVFLLTQLFSLTFLISISSTEFSVLGCQERREKLTLWGSNSRRVSIPGIVLGVSLQYLKLIF